MAQVNRSNIAPLHDKISITISQEDFLPSFEKSLKQHAKNANVPGFRKGHVPTGILKKMYGPSIYQEEVLRAASQELENYMRQEKLSIFAQPMALPSEKPFVIDMAQPEDMTFDFEVALKPDFEVAALTNGHVLTRYKVGITDEMVEEEVNRMTQRLGQMEHPDAIENESDVVFFETGVADQNGHTDRPVLISRLPENLRTKLMGMKGGDELTINLMADFSDENERRTFAQEILTTSDLEADHTAKITKVGRINPATIDEGFFAQAYPNDTPADEASFREKVRADLQREYDRVATERMDNEIFETLVHTTPLDLPRDFLKRWIEQGGPDNKPKSAAQVESEFPQFEHSLKWSLISDKLISENGIQVDMQDIRNDIKARLAGYFGIEDMEDAPWVDGYMKSVEKDEKMINETYQNLLFGRLFETLRTKMASEEKEVSKEDFLALPQPGAAHHKH